MANQIYALTGRRSRPTYVDEINARSPYLGGLYQQKKTDAYNTDIYNLEKQKLAENIRVGNENLALSEKQGKRANAIGALGLGGQLWLGSQKNNTVKDMIEGEGTGNLPGKATGGVSPSGIDIEPSNLTTAIPSSTFSLDKAISPSSYKDAATNWSTYASGVGGGLVGAEAGEVVGEALDIGGTKGRRTVGGALGGAAADRYIAGGDIYSNIFAGLLGGITGRISKGWF